MYIKRSLEPVVLSISNQFKVLLLTGPRQVGKTTLLKQLMEASRQYVTLDDPPSRLLAQSDPQLFLERFPAPVLIDEIQYAPGLLPYIKMEVDKSEARGQYWLAGSPTFHSMRHVSESLAGRVGILNLLGLSNREIDGGVSLPFKTDSETIMARTKDTTQLDLQTLYRRIHNGGMPELIAHPEIDRDVYFASYINTYLVRDIRDLTQVADETTFLRFLTIVAANTAKPVQYEDLARQTGISAPTAKKWLSVLVSSNLIALVQPYHHNLLKRTVKMPLLHFLDTGLCAYLTGWSDPIVLERGAMSGQFFESWAFSELYKSYLNAGLRSPFYYYRDKDKKEIDLLIFENGTLYPIEIKKTASPGTNDMKNFAVLNPFKGIQNESKVELGSGVVICMIPEPMPVNKDNWFVPVRAI
ncbi:MAG: ATP-binding protein [Coriobacteriales bacterium]|jgi:predicted AAA+ superfamily ATPase|nr:ATP-binding protein [Coriobacteriales bacterium]